MFPGPISSRNAAQDQSVAHAAREGHRPGAGRGLARADGHVGRALEDRRDQQRGGLGRVGAVAVGQEQHLEVPQGRERGPDGVPLALLGDIHHSNTQPVRDCASAVGGVIIEDHDLGTR